MGRLAVTGPTGCRYLDDETNQRKYVQQGWNLTGDAYRHDADGYFWYEARTDDMIVSSGYNVSGVEVENVLIAHASVGECAVVGIPDEARGQIVKAFVVPAAGVGGSDTLARELQDFVKSELAPYKYPRAIEFVAELPRTLTGKLQRYRLRADASVVVSASKVQGSEGPGPGNRDREHARTRGLAEAQRLCERRQCDGPRGLCLRAGRLGSGDDAFAAGDFAAEVRQALTNVVAALDAAGARPDQITRLTWYITDRDEYLNARAEIGRAYRDVIGRHFPAMSVVVVQGLIEQSARVEIEATAVVGSDRGQTGVRPGSDQGQTTL